MRENSKQLLDVGHFITVGYAGADPYLLNRMLIIRGLADSLFCGCLIQGTVRQANYSPYYKKSATVGVNYSLTITLSMVLNLLTKSNSLLAGFCF